MADYNTGIIEEFRANHGKVGGFFEGATLLVLHTKGRKSGKPQTVVLNHLKDGDRFVVYGTKGGAPTDPEWVANVLADPSPSIETGTETIPVKAEQITGLERDELYARQVELRPVFGTYPGKTLRVIPVIALEPVGWPADVGTAHQDGPEVDEIADAAAKPQTWLDARP